MFKNLLNGVLWSGLSSLANTFIILVIFVILAIQLGPRAIGLVSMAMVFVAMANRFAGEEIADGIIKKKDLDPADCHTMFWMALATGFGMSLLLFVAAGPIAWIFGEPELIGFVRVLALVPLINAAALVHKALLRRDFEFKALALRTTLSSAIAGVVTVVLAFSGAGAWSLILFHMFDATLVTLMMWMTGKYWPRLTFELSRARPLFRTAYLMSASRILSFAEENMPRFLIGLLAGAEALGIFMLAWNFLISLRRLVWSSLSHVLAVTAAKLTSLEGEEGSQKIQQAFDKAIEIPATLALPAYFGFAAIAPLFFATYFGDQWTTSAEITENLALGIAASLTFFIPLELMRGTLKSQLLPVITGLAVVSNTLFILAFSGGGLNAIAIGLSLHFCLIAGVSLFAQSRALGIQALPIFLKWAKIAAAALVMAIAVRAALNGLTTILPPTVALAMAIAIGALLYGGLLWTLARPTARMMLDMATSVRGQLARG